MLSNLKRIAAGIATSALLATGLVASLPAAADDINVPKLTWPACDDFRTDFCIESVKIQPLGTKTALDLVFTRTQVPAAPAAPTTPATDSASVSPIAPTPVIERVAGNAVVGSWTHPDWVTYGLNGSGYDGLAIDMKAANQFTNNIFFTVLPTMFDEAGKPSVALRAGGSRLALNMDIDSRITVIARIGAVKTGVSIGIANNLTKTSELGTEAAPGKLIMRGTPVPVPQVTSARQCEGENGIASAVVTTMQGFVVVETETSGFGVDGLSGRMAISSNGVACGVSTPVWDDSSETLTWQAGAPHFQPDGTTPNIGFYKAVIPANDALLLWGLSDPARVASALQVSVISEEGGSARVAARNISYLYGNIIIEATGFEYSKPKIQIKKIASYKGFAKPKKLTCTDPVTKKRVTFENAYGCPKAPSKPLQSFVTPQFANTKSSLNATHQRAVVGFLNRFPEANLFTCTGVHSPTATASQRTVAKKRADAVCNFARSKDTAKALTFLAEAKPSASAGFQGRVMITMRDDK
jgi:hypothetical protein